MDFSRQRRARPAYGRWYWALYCWGEGGGGIALLSSCDAMRAMMGESPPDYEQTGSDQKKLAANPARIAIRSR
ncbi:MAG: hypothetical protein LBB47_01175 [Spirochaetaceae bacterium]|jgi:hypothetical protein|nr:hypothetical protein [Spirochaetaceae bacterium]